MAKMRAGEIKKIEEKFLDFARRTRDEHPAKAVTEEEREIYARFLENKGQFQGAASFRNYKTEVKKEVKKRKRL